MATNRPWWKRALSWVATGITTAAAGVASYFFVKTAINDISEDDELAKMGAIVGLGVTSGFFLQLAFNRLLSSSRFYLRRIRNGFNHYKNKFLPYEYSILVQITTSNPSIEETPTLATYFSLRLGSIIADAADAHALNLFNCLLEKCSRNVAPIEDETDSDLDSSFMNSINQDNYKGDQRDLKRYLSWSWLGLAAFSATCHISAWTLPENIEEENLF